MLSPQRGPSLQSSPHPPYETAPTGSLASPKSHSSPDSVITTPSPHFGTMRQLVEHSPGVPSLLFGPLSHCSVSSITLLPQRGGNTQPGEQPAAPYSRVVFTPSSHCSSGSTFASPQKGPHVQSVRQPP